MDHQPVLLKEAIEGLAIKPDGVYVDGTFGRGGHSKAILQNLSDKGRLIALDHDPQAVQIGREQFKQDKRFHIEHCSFERLFDLVKEYGLLGCINGVLLDLGVSSPQLEDPKRGFSFLQEGPLDMRMNTQQKQSAAEWLHQVSEKELEEILSQYGEERYARRIAHAIIEARKEAPIDTTRRLAEIITLANPSRERRKHPATRSFQAIRIFINRELEALRVCLDRCLEILAVGGRLVVISFHSLEDRLVKQFMRKQVRGKEYPLGLPIQYEQVDPPLRVIGKIVKPSREEIRHNPRARSAVMRIAEKIV